MLATRLFDSLVETALWIKHHIRAMHLVIVLGYELKRGMLGHARIAINECFILPVRHTASFGTMYRNDTQKLPSIGSQSYHCLAKVLGNVLPADNGVYLELGARRHFPEQLENLGTVSLG